MKRRGTLSLRISLLAAGVAVITAIVAGLLSVGLISNTESSSARHTLAGIADATQTASDAGASAAGGELRARRLLQVFRVQYATLDKRGRVSFATDSLAQDAIQPADVTKLNAGGNVSASRRVDGNPVLVEGRPTRTGAVLVVQRRSDALAAVGRVVRRVLIALLIAVAIAVALGVLVARRLSRPLRSTARAAHALASGRRDVVVPPEGPAEVAEVGAAVNTLAGNLAFAESRQREFLMSVSHELRTPLTAINGYAESLADGLIGDAETARVGRVMVGESQRLERLVTDLLDLARLDAADFRIDLVATDLSALAAGTAEVWQGRCTAAGVRFVLENAPAPVVAWTDPVRLRQAVDGLLENALRVCPAGAPIVLAVRAEPERGRTVLEVRDGGPGLTEQDLAVAFDRSALFERYRGVRQVGTGLGLAIVHGLVTRLGGTVEAGHAPEGGARFTVRVPAAQPLRPPAATS
ncbi:MAG TPA: HAMP domain-containing sensor histidine kinase [Jatrophihabitantaceae bacterium]